MKRIVCMLVLVCVMLGSFCACIDEYKNQKKYEEGLRYLEEGSYGLAYTVFKNLGDYKDSEKIFSRFVYVRDRVTHTDPSGNVTTEVIYYNEDNLPIQKIVTHPNGRNDICEYTYYSDGRLKNIVYPGSNKIWYKYDAHDNLIKRINIFSWGGKDVLDEYVYDENGRLIEHKGDQYSQPERETYEYDGDGNIVRTVVYYNPSYYDISEFNYDDNGRLISKVVRECDNRPECYRYNIDNYDYTYDSDGNLIKVSQIDEGLRSTNYVYDEASRLISEYYTNAEGEVTSSYEYKYDEKGRLIADNKYEYTYDVLGNLVKTKSIKEYDYYLGRESEYECRLVYIPYDIAELPEESVEHYVQFLGYPFGYTD